MPQINPGDVPWNACPHRARFEEKTAHMEQMTDKMIEALQTELQAATRDIKNEIRHQGELNSQQVSMIESQIKQIVTTMQAHETRIEKLEAAAGKAALNGIKWAGGVVGAILLTYVVTTLLGG